MTVDTAAATERHSEPGPPAPKPRRILVITNVWPLRRARQGNEHRLAVSLSALAELGSIEILHIIPEGVIADYPEGEALDREQSALWGVPVVTRCAPWFRQRRAKTFFTYYLAGMVDAAAQPEWAYVISKESIAIVAAALATRPDLVFLHRLHNALLVEKAGGFAGNTVFDLDDVEHKKLWRLCLLPPLRPGKLLMLGHIPALVLATRRAARRSLLTFVCSELDARHLRRLGCGSGVVAVPNALPVPDDAPGVAPEPTVMFIGAYTYPPNVDAAERLATRILPRIRAAMPEARALIVGKGSELLPSFGRGLPGVEHLGYVDDLAGLYARTRVVCCPLTNGGGTRIKLIEAAAYARPMVSTRIGAEGLEFRDGAEIVLADDDEAIAAACLALLRDDARCAALGAAARQRMQACYAAPAVSERLSRILREKLAA